MQTAALPSRNIQGERKKPTRSRDFWMAVVGNSWLMPRSSGKGWILPRNSESAGLFTDRMEHCQVIFYQKRQPNLSCNRYISKKFNRLNPLYLYVGEFCQPLYFTLFLVLFSKEMRLIESQWLFVHRWIPPPLTPLLPITFKLSANFSQSGKKGDHLKDNTNLVNFMKAGGNLPKGLVNISWR